MLTEKTTYRSKFSEWRMLGLLFFVLVLLGVTGILLYQKLSAAAQKVANSTGTEQKASLIARQISLLSTEAENYVRSYRLTHDNSYLYSFYQLMPSIESELTGLKSRRHLVSCPPEICDSMVTLTQQRFELLHQVLYLENEEKITEELSAVSKSIDEAFARHDDSVATKTKKEQTEPEVKESFFQRLFGRRAKKTANTTNKSASNSLSPPANDTSIRSQLKSTVQKTKQKQLEKLSDLKSRDLSLNLQSRSVVRAFHTLIARLEVLEETELQTRSSQAGAELRSMRNLAFAVSAVLCFLLLVILLLMSSYTRKKKEYELALVDARQKAEELAKSKETFLANMSHEIKTPLNAIHGFTEQMLQSSQDSAQRQQLSIVKKSADYLSKLVSNILHYSKLEAGKLSLDEVDFDLHNELEDLEKLFQQEVRAKGLHFSVLVDPLLPKFVCMDLTCFKQILFNLIGNALKFTEKGQVNVSIEKLTEEKNLLRILVTDTGIGIPATKVPLLFQEYEQASTLIAKKYGGTGLGLVITKKIAEQLGGSIRLKSIENQGTEVEVILPYQPSSPVPPGDSEQSHSVAHQQLQGKTILIVDDEEFNRLLLRSVLSKYGVKLQEATNGAEAVEKVLQQNFDLVIMDIRMPVKNGLEACQEIRKFEKHLPILASTAVISDEKIQRCREAGFSGFLHKPFSEKKLLSIVNDVFNDVPLHTLAPDHEQPTDKPKRLNLAELRIVSGGDKQFEKELIDLFQKSITKGLADMETYAASGDLLEMAELAHKMLPPSKHFEAHKLEVHLRYLENLRHLNTVPNELKQHLQGLRSEVEAIAKELNNISNLGEA